jgi:pyridoxal phosphate enzyme (YggS family)
VTKGFGSDAVAAVMAAGCTMIGENYAQELLAKLDELPATVPRPRVHFIGRLQSNKVRQLAAAVDVWESVDRASLLDEIARRRPGATVLLQVNSTGEAGKGGCPPVEVEALAARARNLDLDLDGLMTVGPTGGDPATTRRAFELTRRLTDALDLATCSMGMSGDLDLAVAAGSTRVRVGTALFGARR